MLFRIPRLLAIVRAAILATLLPACTVLEPGSPSAAVTVKGRSSFQVQDVVERVFTDEGYKPTTRTLEGIAFERDGSREDSVMYGDWLDRKAVTDRVRVTITPNGSETYRLRCLPSVVRDANDASFEDEHRRFEVVSPRLSRILRDVRKQCDELYHSRDTSGGSDQPGGADQPAGTNQPAGRNQSAAGSDQSG